MAKTNKDRDYYIFESMRDYSWSPQQLAVFYNITVTRVCQIYMEQCAERRDPPDRLVIPPTNSKERMAIARFNKLIAKRIKIVSGDPKWFGLDAWTISALRRFGCTDPGKLHMYSSERLLDAPGLGRLRVNRIREVLAARNKYLSGELPGTVKVDMVICPHCEGKVEGARWAD